MRIGANAGSLPEHLQELARKDTAEALVVEALEQVELLEKLDYHDFKISVKASHVPTMIRAYRMLSAKVPYPLHLGVTEAGTPFAGSIKSAVGMGALLMDGIGDTLRVSLTADPVKEVEVAWEILKALGLRERGPVMIACPSCGRDNVGVENLASVVEDRLRAYPQVIEVAVMGCAVNGPGEAGDADFGIAGGRDVGFIYAHGRVLKKVPSDILIDELFREIDVWIADGMKRPKRLKMAKPAALAMAEMSLIPIEVIGRADQPSDVGRGSASPAPGENRRGLGPRRLVWSGNDGGARFTAVPAHASRRTRRRRGRLAQAARPRRVHPPAERRSLDVPAARLARPPEDRADRPGGDGRDRRAGDADAGPHSGGALGADRAASTSRSSSTYRTEAAANTSSR